MKKTGFITGMSTRNMPYDTLENGLSQLVRTLGLANHKVVRMNQTHSAHVQRIGIDNASVLEDTDGIWTTEPGIVVAVKTADCLPVLVMHPQLVGVVHAGREGTELGIMKVFLDQVRMALGIIDGFTFWFGPAICRRCYQIDRDRDLYYDVVARNREQIGESLDLNRSEIVYSNKCTCCQNDQFFSYRKEGDNAGRLWTVGMRT